MLPAEHNAEGFHYIVSYRRRQSRRLDPAVPAGSEVVTLVTDWRQSHLPVDGVGTFGEFVVAVQAANSVGTAPPSRVERRIGYSGQDGAYHSAVHSRRR